MVSSGEVAVGDITARELAEAGFTEDEADQIACALASRCERAQRFAVGAIRARGTVFTLAALAHKAAVEAASGALRV